MWGVYNEENKLHKWLVSPDGDRKEYYTREEAVASRDMYYPDCEVKRLPGKPVYGLWLEHEELKDWMSPSGIIFSTEHRGVAFAQLFKEQRTISENITEEDSPVDITVKQIGENGEPLDIETECPGCGKISTVVNGFCSEDCEHNWKYKESYSEYLNGKEQDEFDSSSPPSDQE